MPPRPRWRRYLRFRSPDIDGDIDEEVRFHLEARAEELVGCGTAPEAAQAQALAEFGDVEGVRAGLRAIDRRMLDRRKRAEWWGALWRDLRLGVRALRRSPGFAAIAVLTLGLGIGAAAAVFSVVNGVLLKPLPYDRPEQLVGLWNALPRIGIPQAPLQDAAYLLYRQSSRVLQDVGLYQPKEVNLIDASRGAAPEHVAAASITTSVVSILRVQSIVGRVIGEEEQRPGAAPVVLVSERLWRRKFGADPGLVGRPIVVDGLARVVVGVMPASFRFPDAGTQLWLPLVVDSAKASSSGFNYYAIARLRPGVSIAAAEADLQRLIPLVPELFPGPLTKSMIEQMGTRAAVHPLRDDVVGDVGRVLWVVLGTVWVVLAIACTNVANLFLVRAEARQKELAVRTALGARRGDILRQFLAETAVLAGLGGALGIGVAVAGVRVLQSLAGTGAAITIPRVAEISVDGRVLGVAGAVAMLAALLVSALPALRYGTPDVASVLKESGRSSTGGRARHRTRDALVVAQVALALVLVASAGLLAKSFWRLRGVETGFDPSRTLTLRLALPAATYPRGADVARFFARTIERVAQLPGVQAAGAVSRLPLQAGDENKSAAYVEDFPIAAGALPPVHTVALATDGYFRAMGISPVAGRAFDPADRERPSDGVVVSRAFAERYWKDLTGQRALGKRLRLTATSAWYTIVGVVESVRGTSLDQPPEAAVYLPLRGIDGDSLLGQEFVLRTMSIAVRTAGDPRLVAPLVREQIHTLDSGLPVFNVQPMSELVAQSMARTSFTLLLLAIASGVALLLGAIGIYGVISYMVSLRTREIGVRIAIGARPADVSRMVSNRGVGLALVGVGLGLVGTLVVARSLRALLFEVSPADPITLAAAAALLVTVAFVASWIPARRAARVDPLVAMRAD